MRRKRELGDWGSGGGEGCHQLEGRSRIVTQRYREREHQCYEPFYRIYCSVTIDVVSIMYSYSVVRGDLRFGSNIYVYFLPSPGSLETAQGPPAVSDSRDDVLGW